MTAAAELASCGGKYAVTVKDWVALRLGEPLSLTRTTTE